MSRLNIETLRYSELILLLAEIETAIAARKTEERADIKQKLAELATKNGFTVEELYGKQRNKKRSEVKYRHPKDPSMTWTGRGRKPRWLNDAVKKGAKLDSFAV